MMEYCSSHFLDSTPTAPTKRLCQRLFELLGEDEQSWSILQSAAELSLRGAAAAEGLRSDGDFRRRRDRVVAKLRRLVSDDPEACDLLAQIMPNAGGDND